MKATDRFLMAIVAGILLVTAIALIVAMRLPREPIYRSDDTPETVAYNYLLALQNGDYERAFNYLAPDLAGRPATPQALAQDLDWSVQQLRSGGTILTVEGTHPIGGDVLVDAAETHYYRDFLSSSSYSTPFSITVSRANGEWKIIHATSYWSRKWETDS